MGNTIEKALLLAMLFIVSFWASAWLVSEALTP